MPHVAALPRQVAAACREFTWEKAYLINTSETPIGTQTRQKLLLVSTK